MATHTLFCDGGEGDGIARRKGIDGDRCPEYPTHRRRRPFRGRIGNALSGEPLAPNGESGVDADSGVRLPEPASPLRKLPVTSGGAIG